MSEGRTTDESCTKSTVSRGPEKMVAKSEPSGTARAQHRQRPRAPRTPRRWSRRWRARLRGSCTPTAVAEATSGSVRARSRPKTDCDVAKVGCASSVSASSISRGRECDHRPPPSGSVGGHPGGGAGSSRACTSSDPLPTRARVLTRPMRSPGMPGTSAETRTDDSPTRFFGFGFGFGSGSRSGVTRARRGRTSGDSGAGANRSGISHARAAAAPRPIQWDAEWR